MKTAFIYALCEPGTRTVRYIGKSNNLKKRFRQHLKPRGKTYLGNWLRSLSSPPVLVILHEVSVSESWQEEERRYISCARAIGMDLVNVTDGGEGASGWKPSAETLAAISAAKAGVPRSPKARAAISASKTGVPHSPEHCAAISAVQKGVPWSPAERAAYEARKRGAFWVSKKTLKNIAIFLDKPVFPGTY